MAMSDFNKRLITSAVMIVVAVVIFLLRAFVANFGIYLVDIVLLVMACMGTWEVANARKLNQRGANAYVAFVVYGLVYLFYLIGSVFLTEPLPWWVQIIISLVIIGIFVLFIGLSNMTDKKFAKECRLEKRNFNKECWLGALDLLKMIFYPGVFFACLVLLNHVTRSELGLFGLLLVMFISCFSDMGAYCVGSVLGKNAVKMAPKLSPKKTWVGFVGGLFCGILGALITVWIISANEAITGYLIEQFGDAITVQLMFAVVGLVGSILTAVGDLYASYIKRQAGVKDYGHIFPGHGGMMDRLDGIIFNAPFILLIMGII